MKNLNQKILSLAKIIILLVMISFSAPDLLATHWNDPPWSSNNVWYTSPYPWTKSYHQFPPPDPAAKNVSLPLNVSDSPQIKNGPLSINIDALNIVGPNQNFALSVPYKGILIGNTNPLNIQSVRGLLHIFKNAANPLQSAVRIDERGVALVTDSPDARIGIGTLNPEYTIDIPQNNAVVRIGGNNFPVPAGVSLQTLGRIRIMGGNPYPGAWLSSFNYEGEAVWVEAIPSSIFPKPYVDFNSTAGITTTAGSLNPLTALPRGLWQVTVWGTTGTACVNCSQTTVIRMYWDGVRENPFSEDILFDTRDNPDGTDPFSVTRIIRIWNTQFNISVSDPGNPSPITGPLINGITAIWLGQ